ncbi:unnamed protein product [Cyclocybe aegerita]|uniref:Fungal-type protein kinase domain-containing protein n=1 Tax=Cyclocybe aegerita TaxID=1973307 RepID=A0A8S0WEW9_CYCAE|nr:unnamed protein product [Cyclocybe aegerita]
MKDTVLGVDKMVTWNGDSRFIEAETLAKKDMKYLLIKPYPVFRSFGIQGRCTTCWRAMDDEGEEVFIKDTHRDVQHGVIPEWKMLLAAQGAEGVGQMLGYEEDISLYHRRGYFRVDENFENPHRNLWNRDILHRDVSLNNVLLGKPNAPAGQRGILIDLDMAVKLGPLDRLPRASDRSGTLSYFSTTILRFATRLSYDPKKLEDPRDYHTHWEDLQSFFYLLCHICLGYSGPGEEADPYPLLLEEWNDDYDTALEAKEEFLDDEGREVYKATPYFGGIFDSLLIELYEFLERTDDEFTRTLVGLSKRLEFITKADIDEYAKTHYEEYLTIIDRAISALEAETQEVVQPAGITKVSTRRAILPQPAPTVVAHVLADIKLNSRQPEGKRKRDALDEQLTEEDNMDNIQGLVKARKVKKAKKAKSAT